MQNSFDYLNYYKIDQLIKKFKEKLDKWKEQVNGTKGCQICEVLVISRFVVWRIKKLHFLELKMIICY